MRLKSEMCPAIIGRWVNNEITELSLFLQIPRFLTNSVYTFTPTYKRWL